MLITKQPQDLITAFNSSGVWAYPTEAVFGLGCNPDDEAAIKKLLKIKKRPVEKGLILIVADFSQVEKYLKPIAESQHPFTKPSDTTYIFPALDSAPKWLTGEFDSLAIRVTQHPIAKEMCQVLNSAIVSTSANLTGKEPARSTQEVIQQLDKQVDAILDGKVGDLQTPTVIRDSISGEIIRPSFR